MDHIPGGVGRARRPGSLIDGVVVGLSLELGIAAALALVASQVPALAWSPPIAPTGLFLVSACSFAMVASLCALPIGRSFAGLVARLARLCWDALFRPGHSRPHR